MPPRPGLPRPIFAERYPAASRVGTAGCAKVQKMKSSPAQLAALVLALTPASFAIHARAQQAVAPDAGCVQQKGSYLCNWSSFKLAFERAHTVSVETGSLDRSTATQVRTLVGELGKSEVPAGHPADLTMLVIPVDTAGMNIGPADHELATLRIYAPNESSSRGTLLWAETYRGQGDRPWPSQVHALIEQFQGRFGKR